MERVWSALPDARDAEIERLQEAVQERDGVIEMILLRELRLREALAHYACACESIHEGCAGGDLADCGWKARAALAPNAPVNQSLTTRETKET